MVVLERLTSNDRGGSLTAEPSPRPDCPPRPRRETRVRARLNSRIRADVVQRYEAGASSRTIAADPYIAALALEIRDHYERHGTKVFVTTSDWKDRMPAKSSLAAACCDLGIDFMMPTDFVTWLGWVPLPIEENEEQLAKRKAAFLKMGKLI